jgi:hypothetical protein
LDTPGASAAAFLRTFGFNLFHGEGGQVYGLDELTGLLRAAGLGHATASQLSGSPLQHLLIATSRPPDGAEPGPVAG